MVKKTWLALAAGLAFAFPAAAAVSDALMSGDWSPQAPVLLGLALLAFAEAAGAADHARLHETTSDGLRT
jgi:hypothetical protein